MSAECGTLAGYTRHRRADETACDECKAAHRDYIRSFRAAKGVSPSSMRLTRARRRAHTRLAAQYPRVFARLLAEEMAAERARA